ncbi:hypothetical protein FE257_002038 [Aspergillus nanangensis]|uniref:Glycoside hydrolase family 76 protein n=1 Tax=Aspergillus nanangensis TaxID=2582783 RepID=A0AAD4CT75_ASPNN|nr:hypothetical protein FE257_002038 [Aspergillus nanangensis]
MKFSTTALLSGALCLWSGQLAVAAESYNTYLSHATDTAKLLIDKYYSDDDGLFDDKWWNTAITYLSLSDLEGIVEGGGKVAGHNLFDMYETLWNRWAKDGINNGNFINHYVDDQGWWALNWIRAYDITKKKKYLDVAGDLVNNMNQWQACGGGIWWSKSEKVLTAVENVVYFSAASYLSNRVSSDNERKKYAGWAIEAWTFMVNSDEWDPKKFTVGGDVNSDTCKISSTNGPSSYTQGALIGGLLEQAKYHDDEGYAKKAGDVAHASITFADWLDENGIFQNSRDNYTNDIATFKGVLMRFILLLHRQYPKQEYVDFMTKQADSIWKSARRSDGTIGAKWQGGEDDPSYSLMCSTNSANQAIIAAAGMLKK